MTADNARNASAIVLDHVRFARGDMVFDFDLAIEASAIVAVIGPSGAGKSTMLDLVAGFETPDSGRILIGGTDMTPEPPSARPVSMLFQENNLFAHLDVAANVGLGRAPDLKLDAAGREAVAAAIVRVGLAGKEKRKPAALSGGERQRVAIARALVRNRPVLLLDEPFASLGPALRLEMLDLVKTLHAETGMTIVMVSHHPQDALYLDAGVIFLENGRPVASGPARTLLREAPPEALQRYLGTKAVTTLD